MNHKIGIVGVGFVGSALAEYFKNQPVELFLYDKFKSLGEAKEINRVDVVFICVPTPFLSEKGFDISAVEESILMLEGEKIVVIKSSVIPGQTDRLQQKFLQHRLIFNPEFLREVSAYEDLIHPDRQIVGVTQQSEKVGKLVLGLLPKANYEKIIPAKEAEMIKYMCNAFLALKVVFGNEFYEICEKSGINYEQVRDAVAKDPRIGDSHFNVADGGYRGYGGSCFPKDVNAIIQLAESKGADVTLLKSMRDINRSLLEKSGLNEEHFLQGKHKKIKG